MFILAIEDIFFDFFFGFCGLGSFTVDSRRQCLLFLSRLSK